MEHITVYPATPDAFAPATFPTLQEALAHALPYRMISGAVICSALSGYRFAVGYRFPWEQPAPVQLAMEYVL